MGPFPVLQHKDKYSVLLVNDRPLSVSIDRLKTHHHLPATAIFNESLDRVTDNTSRRQAPAAADSDAPFEAQLTRTGRFSVVPARFRS